MRPKEIAALGELAGELIGGATDRVREVHGGISRRIFGLIGPAARPIRIVHDAVAGLAYAGTREVTRGALTAGALAASATQPADAPALEEDPLGRRLLGALNGVVGDRLERKGSPLALRMTVHTRGTSPGPRLAVFVHGLGQTDDAWLARDDQHVPYGYRLEAELGYTPLYIRYNTGRHVSENGRELSNLLEGVVAEWPVEVREIALVGHAMGGLVARAACHYGSGCAWSRLVRHVIMLGAPHGGTPLEQLTATAGGVLARLPETRPLAKAIEQRSAGIKDLRHGYVVDEDWREDTPHEVPFLAGAKHYFVSAGDLWVTRGSAWARRAREPVRFPAEHYAHIDGVSHFGLLNHPAVYAQIHWWLCSRRALPAPRRALPPA
jgi:triacylglycerol esterase/lipase EstA (alpha/beta hydrolase family)